MMMSAQHITFSHHWSNFQIDNKPSGHLLAGATKAHQRRHKRQRALCGAKLHVDFATVLVESLECRRVVERREQELLHATADKLVTFDPLTNVHNETFERNESIEIVVIEVVTRRIAVKVVCQH